MILVFVDLVRNIKNAHATEWIAIEGKNMKYPKCGSLNTKKVYVSDPNWHVGHERCQSVFCKYQGHWLEFCDPPLYFNKIIIGIDEE